MTKDEIIEIAKEHFYSIEYDDGVVHEFYEFSFEELVDFAKLIAEKEREECAKICEELRDNWFRGLGRYEFMGEGADYCVDAIRERKQE